MRTMPTRIPAIDLVRQPGHGDRGQRDTASSPGCPPAAPRRGVLHSVDHALLRPGLPLPGGNIRVLQGGRPHRSRGTVVAPGDARPVARPARAHRAAAGLDLQRRCLELQPGGRDLADRLVPDRPCGIGMAAAVGRDGLRRRRSGRARRVRAVDVWRWAARSVDGSGSCFTPPAVSASARPARRAWWCCNPAVDRRDGTSATPSARWRRGIKRRAIGGASLSAPRRRWPSSCSARSTSTATPGRGTRRRRGRCRRGRRCCRS